MFEPLLLAMAQEAFAAQWPPQPGTDFVLECLGRACKRAGVTPPFEPAGNSRVLLGRFLTQQLWIERRRLTPDALRPGRVLLWVRPEPEQCAAPPGSIRGRGPPWQSGVLLHTDGQGSFEAITIPAGASVPCVVSGTIADPSLLGVGRLDDAGTRADSAPPTPNVADPAIRDAAALSLRALHSAPATASPPPGSKEPPP
jgi:hypothetical protein